MQQLFYYVALLPQITITVSQMSEVLMMGYTASGNQQAVPKLKVSEFLLPSKHLNVDNENNYFTISCESWIILKCVFVLRVTC